LLGASGCVCGVDQAFLQKVALARTPEQQQAALPTELDRLDELQRICWASTTEGDPKAAHLALKIIAERAKLLGLDRPPEDAREQQTIVISRTSEEYIAGLKSMIAAS